MAEASGEDEKRRKPRYEVNVPAQMNGDGYHDISVIDISPTGMQIHSVNHDIFKGQGYMPNRRDQLKICVNVRLAWAEPHPEGGFLTGWEFEMDSVQENSNSD